MTTIKRARNSAKRLLITCVIDISPSTNMKGDFGNATANALINKHLRLFICQLLANKKIKASAEICFITYSSEVTVSDFVPLKTLENNIPTFETVTTGGTRTIAAIDAAYKAIHKRASEITSHAAVGCGLYTSVMFLLTDGDASQHDSPEYRDSITKMVNECTIKTERTEKILPFVIGLGSHISDKTKTMLANFSKGFLDGFFYLPGNTGDAEKDYSKLFRFLSESLVTSIRTDSEVDVISEDGFSTDSVDELLDELRALVYEEYPEMVCTVTD